MLLSGNFFLFLKVNKVFTLVGVAYILGLLLVACIIKRE